MKMGPKRIVTLLILLTLFPLTTFAQDYTQWSLPDGATARLGKGQINELAYSPDGTRLAVASSIGIWLYDTETGGEVALLTGHTGSVRSVAFRPDGRTLASGSYKEIHLWDAASGAHIRTLTGHTWSVLSVAFRPDGRTIASGSDDSTIRLWDAESGAHIRTLTGHTRSVSSVAFSPDGRTIASGSGDSTIRLWDAGTGAHIRTLTGHTRGVYGVAFRPDGRTLASGSGDGTVLLWELTPTATTTATVSVSPSEVPSPAIGEQLTLSLNITDGENVAGYQGTVQFDTSALRYVESATGDFLPAGAFFVPPVVEGNKVTLASSAINAVSNGDGTLATLTFEVVEVKASTVTLSQVALVDPDGEISTPQIENGEITEPPQLVRDVNDDGVVNIQDLVIVGANFGKTGENPADVNDDGVVNIVDLVTVASAFGTTAAAPVLHLHVGTGHPSPTVSDVQGWLTQARALDLTDATVQRGIIVLEHLLAAVTPKETTLLPNYPNPFNPETWIPYQLATDSDVTLTIYTSKGAVVRRFELGHQPAGFYTARAQAAYWNGRNASGESVASGVYFYQLRAGDYTALRRMVILK